MAFGIGDRAKLPVGTDPKVLSRNNTLEDYELALTIAESEIVELEQRLDAALAEIQRQRQRADHAERSLQHRRQHSNTITIVGVTNGRKS